MKLLSTCFLVVAAVIKLLPVAGLLSADRLQAAYGVVLADNNLLILMQHRAVLFSIVGGLLMVSAFHLPLRKVALVCGLVSAVSFLVLFWVVGGTNAEMQRIAAADVVVLVSLVASGTIDHLTKAREGS